MSTTHRDLEDRAKSGVERACAEQGVPVKLSDPLPRSARSSFEMDVYVHLLPDGVGEAPESVDRLGAVGAGEVGEDADEDAFAHIDRVGAEAL